MSEIKFVDGLVVQAPRDNAPEYVKARIWIKRAQLVAWLESQVGDSINVDVKVSQGGKWYAAVDDWKPNHGNSTPRNNAPRPQRREPEPAKFDDDFGDSDIPFATNRGMY